MKTYDRQILQILYDVGDKGIAVRKLALHVYNLNCTLFSQPDLQTVHSYVQQYLLKKIKSAQPLIERTDRRGYYRLNTRGTSAVRQFLLDSIEQNGEETDEQKEWLLPLDGCGWL